MDEKHPYAKKQFFAAVRTLAASADSIQTRLIEANTSILTVTIDEFDKDIELKIKFARILDLLAVDRDDMEEVAIETAAHMTESEAMIVAELICDFFEELD
ncbi:MULTISPECIES: hypothetical protein [unclassified Ensifer]|jgi:hypothetical protein|uniref:hypothetical protein n=1 Tax=unclassified Ensifer TaxID=2633371 RepID=UPI00070E2C67|nr:MULTISPECIES: hypothetical protein [unclassified Ensifer]KQU73562.1 hypothetical protein ASD00_37975 [Ensifer sp. Root31]KQW37284.1 hypothetical protein ASD02_36405 [Ensifer sp. Root1252]KRC69419.1 hypothetical protein ASE32_34805 [Ensifer sp. Root231]KRC91049.1 hypothetical protein ASE47_36400 [Ensifer sp. Root258]